jgi:hypothetical protein
MGLEDVCFLCKYGGNGLPNFAFISPFSISKTIHVHPYYIFRCKISSEVSEFISGPNILRYLIVLLFLGLKKIIFLEF